MTLLLFFLLPLTLATAMPDRSDDFSAPTLEREVLGAAMVDDEAAAHLVGLLDEAHFADPRRQRTFRAVLALFSEGAPVNLSTVAERAEDVSANYVSDLTDAVASTANVEHHARIITQKWMERETLNLLTQAEASVGDYDIFEVIDRLQQRFSELIIARSTETHIREAVGQALERAEEWKQGLQTDYMPTGFYSLDRAIGGYPAGELTTIGAMTGAGKTSFLVQSLRTIARIEAGQADPRAVLLFSAEMTREQIAQRAASSKAQVNLRELRFQGEHVESEEFERYESALADLTQVPYHVDDTAAPSFAHIRARCEQVRAQEGLSFIGVDYDEKINAQGQTEELRVSAIAKGLKSLAKRFQVPVVSLSQYSRKATYDQWPDNSWLRYSGKKEQESAVILHWVWPQYWVEQGVKPFASETERQNEKPQVVGYVEDQPERGYLRCSKNRHGPMGNTRLDFYPAHTRFDDPNKPKR